MADGTILLEYGDPNLNTGPVDVLGWLPGVGLVTFLTGFDSERIEYVDLGGDWIVGLSIDPKLNLHSHIVSNRSGTFEVLDVFVFGVDDAVHLLGADYYQGVLRVCGARTPDTAIVWASEDFGTTWTEELAHDGIDTEGYCRFYSIGRAGGKPVVSTIDGSGDYLLDGGVWTNVSTQTRDTVPARRGPNGEVYETDGTTVWLVT